MPNEMETDPSIRNASAFVWSFLKRRMEADGTEVSDEKLKELLSLQRANVRTDGNYRFQKMTYFQKISDYSTSYDGDTGEQFSWFFDRLMDGTERSIDREKGLKIAEAEVDVPPQAVLSVCEYEEQGGLWILVVRWIHVHKGIPVEGDYAQALINGKTGKVFSYSRRWRQILMEG